MSLDIARFTRGEDLFLSGAKCKIFAMHFLGIAPLLSQLLSDMFWTSFWCASRTLSWTVLQHFWFILMPVISVTLFDIKVISTGWKNRFAADITAHKYLYSLSCTQAKSIYINHFRSCLPVKHASGERAFSRRPAPFNILLQRRTSSDGWHRPWQGCGEAAGIGQSMLPQQPVTAGQQLRPQPQGPKEDVSLASGPPSTQEESRSSTPSYSGFRPWWFGWLYACLATYSLWFYTTGRRQ